MIENISTQQQARLEDDLAERMRIYIRDLRVLTDSKQEQITETLENEMKTVRDIVEKKVQNVSLV